MTDLEKFGALGEEIQNFDMNEYRGKIEEKLKERVYSLKKFGNSPFATDFSKFLDNPDLFEVFVKQNLFSQFFKILSEVKDNNSDVLHFPDFMQPELCYYGPNTAVEVSDRETLHSIKAAGVEGIRKILFDMAGFEYTSLDDLKQMAQSDDISQDEKVELFFRNGYDGFFYQEDYVPLSATFLVRVDPLRGYTADQYVYEMQYFLPKAKPNVKKF